MIACSTRMPPTRSMLKLQQDFTPMVSGHTGEAMSRAPRSFSAGRLMRIQKKICNRRLPGLSHEAWGPTEAEAQQGKKWMEECVFLWGAPTVTVCSHNSCRDDKCSDEDCGLIHLISVHQKCSYQGSSARRHHQINWTRELDLIDEVFVSGKSAGKVSDQDIRDEVESLPLD